MHKKSRTEIEFPNVQFALNEGNRYLYEMDKDLEDIDDMDEEYDYLE